MRKSSGDSTINTNELNNILPSYLLNEMEEDNKDKKLKEESKINNFYNEKVSKIFFNILILNYIFKINYFYRILTKLT